MNSIKKVIIVILLILLPVIFFIIFPVITVGGILPPSENKDNKTIVIWGYDSYAVAAKKAVELYREEHPDCEYKFEVITLGQDDMVEKLKIYLATGSMESLPDIFADEDYNFMEYIGYNGQYFVDLTPYLHEDSYYKYKLINVKYDNKIYAIPYDCGTGVLFYRIDLIEKAGYHEDDMSNLTWDQYIEIGQKVKETTGIDMVTIVPEGDMEGRLLYQSAGTWFFDENGNANIGNNEAFVDASRTIKKTIDSGIVYKASSWDDIISAISNEKIASLVGASWWAPIITSYKNQSGLWRVAEMPRMTGSANYSSYSNLGGGNWFVLNKSNKKFASEFAVEMFGENLDLANYVSKNYYIIPVNKNIVENLTDNGSAFFGGQHVVSFMCETGSKIQPVKYGLHTYEVTYTVGGYEADYINGKISLDEAISKMQNATEKVVGSN